MSVATIGIAAQQPIDPNRFEPAIQKFEAEDKATPPVKGGVLFIGASSIARWTNLAESFPDLRVVNRGFGGSELSEAVKYAPRVVVPHAPRIVVLYAGENDLNRGVTPDVIASDFDKFLQLIHTSLPATRTVVIGLKPSLLRWKLRDGMHQTNKLIRTRCAADRSCVVCRSVAVDDRQGRHAEARVLRRGRSAHDAGRLQGVDGDAAAASALDSRF